MSIHIPLLWFDVIIHPYSKLGAGFVNLLVKGAMGPGPEVVSILRYCLANIGIPMLNIRRLWDRLVFIIDIFIPGKTVLMLRRGLGDKRPLLPYHPNISTFPGYTRASDLDVLGGQQRHVECVGIFAPQESLQ